MKNKKKSVLPFWVVFLIISLLFLWLGIKSSVIYKSSGAETVSTYVYEKNINNEVSITNFPKICILNHNSKAYTIIKDRDTTIVLKNLSENKDGIYKESKEYLVYHKNTDEFIKRNEVVYKDTGKARKISNLSISHFIIVGLPSYFASLIFFLITIFIFITGKDEHKK